MKKNVGKNVSGFPGKNPSGVVAGNVASKGAMPAKPWAKGGSGLPASMKKALTKKTPPSKGL